MAVVEFGRAARNYRDYLERQERERVVGLQREAQGRTVEVAKAVNEFYGRPSERACLYLIVALVDGVKRFGKVGIAVDPSDRVGLLQCGSPLELRLEAVVWFGTRDTARLEEKRAHRALKASGVRGEWFAYEDAIRYLQERHAGELVTL